MQLGPCAAQLAARAPPSSLPVRRRARCPAGAPAAPARRPPQPPARAPTRFTASAYALRTASSRG